MNNFDNQNEIPTLSTKQIIAFNLFVIFEILATFFLTFLLVLPTLSVLSEPNADLQLNFSIFLTVIIFLFSARIFKKSRKVDYGTLVGWNTAICAFNLVLIFVQLIAFYLHITR